MPAIQTGTTYVPWWKYPRIDNYGGVEPFGGFAKPDSNIQIPADYPVTALLPGVVTALDSGNVAWGAVVTIRLDTPINAIATHTAYLHLASTTVSVGQHVNSGDLIGYNGYQNAAGTQKVPLGFALYNGDHYGFGASWGQYLGSAALNPVPLLDAAANGQLSGVISGTLAYAPQGSGTTIGSVISTTIETVSGQAHDIINTVPGFLGICEALDIVEQFVPFTLTTSGQQALNTATQNNDIQIFGWDTGIINPFGVAQSATAAVQLPADTLQAVFVFLTTNAMAFIVRSLFVLVGLVLFLALMGNIFDALFNTQTAQNAITDVSDFVHI